MGLPVTPQDIIHGVDFTALNPQSASEHNQLVDLSTPYTDGADNNQGIGFVITTTDIALGLPAAPDPTTGPLYYKWKRYLWNRRSYGSSSPIGVLYQWNDTVTAVALFNKWIPVDPNAYLTIGATTKSLLSWVTQAIGDSANATAAAATAANVASNLTTAVYGNPTDLAIAVGGTPLATQVGTVQTKQTADEAAIDAIQTAISGTVGSVVATGGINGEIAALQTQIGTVASGATNVGNLNPGTQGQMLRTDNVSGTAKTVWYDPATSEAYAATGTPTATLGAGASSAIALTGLTTIPPGTYIVFATMSSRSNGVSNTALTLSILVGSTVAAFGLGTGSVTGGSDWPVFAAAMGIITIAKSVGSQTLSAKITTTIACSLTGQAGGIQVLLYRVKLGV